jgi:hypothetical protein
MEKKRKKKYTPPLKRLEKECYDLWSKCIVARDKVCRYSKSSDRLSAHHIRSRTHASTRFSLDNGICLSWKVHFLQKANPERFQDMVIEVIGQDRYEELKKRSLVVAKQTVSDLEQIKFDLQKQLTRIQNGIDFDDLPF